jgi:hypothetical protein
MGWVEARTAGEGRSPAGRGGRTWEPLATTFFHREPVFHRL